MIRVRDSDHHDVPAALARNGVAAAIVVAEHLEATSVKSDSSQVIKMTELPVQALEFMIALTVLSRNESPAAIKACTWEKSQGSLGILVPPRPCMSWHWSGLIQV